MSKHIFNGRMSLQTLHHAVPTAEEKARRSAEYAMQMLDQERTLLGKTDEEFCEWMAGIWHISKEAVSADLRTFKSRTVINGTYYK